MFVILFFFPPQRQDPDGAPGGHGGHLPGVLQRLEQQDGERVRVQGQGGLHAAVLG
jgi:hypothetical protein